MKKYYYLAFAIIGLIASFYFVGKFYVEGDGDLLGALALVSSTTMGQLLAADFTIVVFAIWTFIYIESKRLNMRFWWVYIFLTAGIGLCFALPLFLYFRESKLTVN